MPSPAEPLHLLNELREGRRDLVKTGGPALLATIVGFLIAFYFVEPPPPRELVIATGPADGNYYAAARQYAPLFEKNGIKLTIRETAGTVENYDLLLNDDSVQLAIVQGGTVPEVPQTERLESIATLYLEPVWVFYRSGQSITRLTDLRGKRIAIGADGSGTHVLTEMLLRANGVQDGREETVFVMEKGRRAIGMLHDGDVDVAFFVLSADSPIVLDLLQDEELKLLSFHRSQAYAQRYRFLESVMLAQGVVDLQGDIPRNDVNLIAPVANLVATHKLHDAFIPLLLEAATEAHEAGGLVTDAGEQPSLDGVEFPPNAVARHYLKYGPSFFQKHMGFWMASLIDRAKIMLVPLLILLIPLAKLAPPVYRWRIRSRIYRWYALLRGIDQTLRDGDNDALQEIRKKLIGIERELEEVTVPLSYMEEFYHLRLHIDLVKRQVEQRKTEPDGA
ncbi:MAG: TAXI family TRAP transporter solute-binding subunit [Pirellulaceae bacterium]|jgi:TRAP transporter TAXI family solute receptor|nr:TAXI family TRAP transporter solute-binding subunit [Pirellulaceae bacterium]